MAKRNHSPGIKQLTRRGMARFIARTRKFVDAKAKDRDANSRAAARRRKQMLAGKLKASNGVVMQFDDAEQAGNGLCEAIIQLAEGTNG